MTLADVQMGKVCSKQQCYVRNDYYSIKQTLQILNLKVNNMQADLNAKIKHIVDMFDQCLKVKNKAECSLTVEKSQLSLKPISYPAAVIKCLTDAMTPNSSVIVKSAVSESIKVQQRERCDYTSVLVYRVVKSSHYYADMKCIFRRLSCEILFASCARIGRLKANGSSV